MKSVEFCYWLQGYFEINGKQAGRRAGSLSAKQVENIKKHLALVFKHEIDASYPDHEELNAIHNPWPPTGGDTPIRC